VGGWAFEWDTFEVTFKESERAKPVTIHGKALRVLKRQPDGSWKFARVMAVTDSRKQ
jgi:ketosteroid isomerase-like protein